MHHRPQITLDQLEMFQRHARVVLFEATLAPVAGAGYRVFLHGRGIEYEVVYGVGETAVYFPDFLPLLDRLVRSGVISHRVVVDAVGLMSGSRFHKGPRCVSVVDQVSTAVEPAAVG